jgi:chromosome segregation ATPase
MLEIIITAIIAPVVPTIVAHYLTKRSANKKLALEIEKAKGDLDGIQGQNYKIYIEAYQAMLDDLAKRNEDSLKSNREQRIYYEKKLEELKSTIDKLSSSNRQLHNDIKQLKKDYPCPDCVLKSNTKS